MDITDQKHASNFEQKSSLFPRSPSFQPFTSAISTAALKTILSLARKLNTASKAKLIIVSLEAFLCLLQVKVWTIYVQEVLDIICDSNFDAKLCFSRNLSIR